MTNLLLRFMLLLQVFWSLLSSIDASDSRAKPSRASLPSFPADLAHRIHFHDVRNDTNKYASAHLGGLNVSSLSGWDFRSTHQPNFLLLDLSNNRLRQISDKETSFGNAHITLLDLFSNKLKKLDLSHTSVNHIIVEDNLLMNIENSLLLTSRLNRLDLSGNPIGSLSHFKFPFGKKLCMRHCDISSMTNVIFSTEEICLCHNPLKTIKNVTVQNAKFVQMCKCGLTLSKLKKFEISCTGNQIDWDLRKNHITLYQLEKEQHKLQKGVSSIRIDDRTTYKYPS